MFLISIGHFAYQMPWPERPFTLFVFMSVAVLAFRSLGLIIASVVNGMQESQILIQLFYLPMLFLSGATFPVSSMPQWLQILATPRPGEPPDPNHPTPAEVTQAIDALGILRTLAPAKAFALATDDGLKLRALRNPWCRAKAMQIYGITLPAGDGAAPPDIGQLLHLKPDDNCPICRQRAQMQAAPGDL